MVKEERGLEIKKNQNSIKNSFSSTRNSCYGGGRRFSFLLQFLLETEKERLVLVLENLSIQLLL